MVCRVAKMYVTNMGREQSAQVDCSNAAFQAFMSILYRYVLHGIRLKSSGQILVQL